MKFILVIEDTTRGIRCKAAYNPNDVTDHLAESIAAKTVANFSESLRELEKLGLLYVEKD